MKWYSKNNNNNNKLHRYQQDDITIITKYFTKRLIELTIIAKK